MKISHALLSAALLAGAAGTASVTAATAQTASQGVVVLDMERLRAQSLAFQDMATKMQTIAEQQADAFRAANAAEAQAIQTQARTLQPALKGKTPQEIEANPTLKTQVQQQVQREQSLATKERLLQLSIQKTSACAEQAAAKALDPIIEKLMQQYNASIVLSRDVVAKVKPTVDITQAALDQYNTLTKTINVVWAPVVEGQNNQTCPN
jgi:Skp family chaperone for outer membrane proteins